MSFNILECKWVGVDAMNAQRLMKAFLIALIVSGLCTWMLGNKMRTSTAPHEPDKYYVAPNGPLQAGQIIKPGDLKTVSWPGSHPVTGSFTKSEELVGRAVLYPLDSDQPITERSLGAAGSGMGLAGRIPAGMRAIALRSDEVMGVAGFLFPGSHLDVLVTYRTDKSPEPTTLTVLQNAEVLAAGQRLQPDPEGKPVTATVVTLLLTPQDAQRAVLASTQGAIHFVLRSGSDKVQVQESALTLSELSGAAKRSNNAGPQSKTLVPRVQHVVAPRQIVIETIAGEVHSSDSFSGGK